VRAFSFSSHKDLEGARSFAISLNPEAALYAPLRASYMLGKRKRQDFANIPVPKKVCLPSLAANLFDHRSGCSVSNVPPLPTWSARRLVTITPPCVQVTVSLRELNAEEAEARTERMQCLFGIDDD
jgi:hypothetical protein